MEKVKLKKTKNLTDFTPFIESFSFERVRNGSNYQYLDKLSDYKHEFSVKRETQNGATQLVGDRNDWSLFVDTNFLHDMKEGEIFELGAYFYFSRKYSKRHSSCFVVLKNTKNYILLGIASSPFQIFKQTSSEFMVDKISTKAKQKAIKVLEKIKAEHNVRGKIKFEKFKDYETNALWMSNEMVYILEGSKYRYEYGLATSDCVVQKNGWAWVYYLDCPISSNLAEKINSPHREKISKERNEQIINLLENEKRVLISNKRRVMIEHNDGIYLAHPHLLHNDHSKNLVFRSDKETIELMHYYNSEVKKLLQTSSQLPDNEREILAKENRAKMLRVLEYAKEKVNSNEDDNEIMIEGHTGIYLTNSLLLHRDCDKLRVYDKNDETLALMKYFNTEIAAYRDEKTDQTESRGNPLLFV